MTTKIRDRYTDELLSRLDQLAAIEDDALFDLETRVACQFTAYALHAKLPVDRQGDRDEKAWAIRAQRQDAAEQLWLAIQAERAVRR